MQTLESDYFKNTLCSYKQLSESEIRFIPTDKKMVHVNIPIENILQTLQFSENI